MRNQAEFLEVMDAMFGEAGRRGLMHRELEDEALDGRHVTIDGRPLIHFGSCSYLGLELDPRLRQGAADAIMRYGTQFSASRVFLSTPLYAELEGLLAEVIGQPALVAPTTSLAHVSALPALIDAADAVILDQQVHASVRMATNHVRVAGVPVEVVRHNRLDLLEARIRELRRTHRRIWYLADGVYSIFGDRAPMAGLADLLARYEALHLYVDDAHAMSWCGLHGRGHALSHLSNHPRVVVTSSLNKAFAAGGGLLAVPDEALRRKIRTTGTGLVFSGPLQPAMLGAAVASARLHLTAELPARQAALASRIARMNALLLERGLPLVGREEVPVRFVGLSSPRAAYAVAGRLVEAGYFPNVAVYPAVPMRAAGIRFTITTHLQDADLVGFADALAEAVDEALRAEGLTAADVLAAFDGPTAEAPAAAAPAADVVAPASLTIAVTGRVAAPPPGLVVQRETTIDALDPALWDRLLGDRGTFDVAGLRFLEATFREGGRPEDAWRFRYFVVRDAAGRPVLATFFTLALGKDDQLADAAVSRRLEARREADPYYLTSLNLQMGAPLTEGDHLWLDRDADWRGALRLVLRAAEAERAAAGAQALLLRDLDPDDAELGQELHEAGFVRLAMPASWTLETDGRPFEAHVAGLSRNNRRHHRLKVAPWRDAYRLEVIRAGDRALAPAEEARFQALYRNVHARGRLFNTFALPDGYFGRTLAHPGWEVLALRLEPAFGGDPAGPVVGVATAYAGPAGYVPFAIGLDYAHVHAHGLYRHFMQRAYERARAHGARRVLLGFGAPLEKQRFGARPVHRAVWARAVDDYRLEVLAAWMGGRTTEE